MERPGDIQDKHGLDAFVQPLEDTHEHPESVSIPRLPPSARTHLPFLSLLLPTSKCKQLLPC